MRILQSPPQLCYHSKLQFYEATITYEHALWKVCAVKGEKIDTHAKYDQDRRGRKSQGGKYLPTGPQSLFLVGKG